MAQGDEPNDELVTGALKDPQAPNLPPPVLLHGTGEGRALPDAPGECVSVPPAHYAAAERLAQLVEVLLPDQTRQKRIDMSLALLDFYKTR